MPRPRQLLSAVFLVSVFLTAACCTGPAAQHQPQSVLGCAHCGDPHTVIGDDGRGHVQARWNVPDGPVRRPFERIDAVRLVPENVTATPPR